MVLLKGNVKQNYGKSQCIPKLTESKCSPKCGKPPVQSPGKHHRSLSQPSNCRPKPACQFINFYREMILTETLILNLEEDQYFPLPYQHSFALFLHGKSNKTVSIELESSRYQGKHQAHTSDPVSSSSLKVHPKVPSCQAQLDTTTLCPTTSPSCHD